MVVLDGRRLPISQYIRLLFVWKVKSGHAFSSSSCGSASTWICASNSDRPCTIRPTMLLSVQFVKNPRSTSFASLFVRYVLWHSLKVLPHPFHLVSHKNLCSSLTITYYLLTIYISKCTDTPLSSWRNEWRPKTDSSSMCLPLFIIGIYSAVFDWSFWRNAASVQSINSNETTKKLIHLAMFKIFIVLVST